MVLKFHSAGAKLSTCYLAILETYEYLFIQKNKIDPDEEYQFPFLVP